MLRYTVSYLRCFELCGKIIKLCDFCHEFPLGTLWISKEFLQKVFFKPKIDFWYNISWLSFSFPHFLPTLIHTHFLSLQWKRDNSNDNKNEISKKKNKKKSQIWNKRNTKEKTLKHTFTDTEISY